MGAFFNLAPNDSPTLGLTSMGMVSAPYVDNGQLFLHYTSAGNATYETYIFLTCGTTLGVPYFVRVDNSRTLLVNWETSAACPVRSQRGEFCRVMDPVTGSYISLYNLHQAGPQKCAGGGN